MYATRTQPNMRVHLVIAAPRAARHAVPAPGPLLRRRDRHAHRARARARTGQHRDRSRSWTCSPSRTIRWPRRAKDAAAGAVLVASLASVGGRLPDLLSRHHQRRPARLPCRADGPDQRRVHRPRARGDRDDLRQGLGRARLGAPRRRRLRARGPRLCRGHDARVPLPEAAGGAAGATSSPSWWPRAGSRRASTAPSRSCGAPFSARSSRWRSTCWSGPTLCYNGADLNTDPSRSSAPAPGSLMSATRLASDRCLVALVLAGRILCRLRGGAGLDLAAARARDRASAASRAPKTSRSWSRTRTAS